MKNDTSNVCSGVGQCVSAGVCKCTSFNGIGGECHIRFLLWVWPLLFLQICTLLVVVITSISDPHLMLTRIQFRPSKITKWDKYQVKTHDTESDITTILLKEDASIPK
jgi:hypothetical protein